MTACSKHTDPELRAASNAMLRNAGHKVVDPMEPPPSFSVHCAKVREEFAASRWHMRLAVILLIFVTILSIAMLITTPSPKVVIFVLDHVEDANGKPFTGQPGETILLPKGSKAYGHYESGAGKP